MVTLPVKTLNRMALPDDLREAIEEVGWLAPATLPRSAVTDATCLVVTCAPALAH